VSAAPATLDHVPGELLLSPELVGNAPSSFVGNPVASVVDIPPPVTFIMTFHCVIAPVGPVPNWNKKAIEGVRFVSVCTPSENVNAVGVTVVSGMFGAKGGRQRHHCRHEVARGVRAAHDSEWVPSVLVRGGLN
jgi:hypothetical protein